MKENRYSLLCELNAKLLVLAAYHHDKMDMKNNFTEKFSPFKLTCECLTIIDQLFETENEKPNYGIDIKAVLEIWKKANQSLN
jgi:hypothetical protein